MRTLFDYGRGQADMLKSLRNTVAVLGLGLAISGTATGGEIVFDNMDKFTDKYVSVPGQFEYGDELILTGTARTVTDFIFEYFADFTPTGLQAGKIRFYKNDLFIDNPGTSSDYWGPGTMIWESSTFALHPGSWEMKLEGINVTVPDNFTYTMEFKGVAMTAKNEAGLIFHDPNVIGKSFDDYWARQLDGTWKLKDTPGLKDNFGATVIAVPEPSTIGLLTVGLAALVLGFRRRS